MKNKVLLISVTIIFIIIAVILTNTAITRINLKYSPENQLIAFFDDTKLNLVIEDELVNQYGPPIIDGRELLLPYELIKNYIDDSIYLDQLQAKITITSEDSVIRIDQDELQAYLNQKPYQLDAAAQYINETLYVPVLAFVDIFNITVSILEKDNVIIIDKRKNYSINGLLTNESAIIRSEPSIYKEAYQVYNPSKIEVRVFEMVGDWSKVRTIDGVIGYVQNQYLKTSMVYQDVILDIRRTIPGEIDTIIFAWEAFYSETKGDASLVKSDNLNVVSPTWFKVVDQVGNMDSFASAPYVEKAHELGYQVWPLLSNTFNDIELTSTVLNNPAIRDHMIRQLISYVALYEFDGINIDFENIYLKDKDAYTQFIKELVPMLHLAGVKVSVAVGVPGGSETYSLCYDHEQIGLIADYVMVMTYDQHYAGSPVAGSQAQVTWMEDKIIDTLELVSNEQLVMGIPLYTRLWEITDSGVKNIKSYSIDGAKKLIEEKNALLEWDEQSGQHVATYIENGITYKMWLEDEISLQEKVSLVNEYELKGICLWELNWGNDSIWEAIEKALNKGSE